MSEDKNKVLLDKLTEAQSEELHDAYRLVVDTLNIGEDALTDQEESGELGDQFSYARTAAWKLWVFAVRQNLGESKFITGDDENHGKD